MLVATYNVLHLDPNDPSARFTRLAIDIGPALNAPDVVVL